MRREKPGPDAGRLREVADILALGVLRRKLREGRKARESAIPLENPLALSRTPSIHVLGKRRRERT